MMKEKFTTGLVLRLPASLRVEFQMFADEYGLTMSAIIRALIEAFLRGEIHIKVRRSKNEWQQF